MARGDRHGFRLHPEKLCRGQDRTQAKLNNDAVREIRRRAAAGEPQSALVDEFRVSAGLICMVIKRQRWKHID